jgi:hypothetical protein
MVFGNWLLGLEGREVTRGLVSDGVEVYGLVLGSKICMELKDVVTCCLKFQDMALPHTVLLQICCLNQMLGLLPISKVLGGDLEMLGNLCGRDMVQLPLFVILEVGQLCFVLETDAVHVGFMRQVAAVGRSCRPKSSMSLEVKKIPQPHGEIF